MVKGAQSLCGINQTVDQRRVFKQAAGCSLSDANGGLVELLPVVIRRSVLTGQKDDALGAYG